MQRRGHDEQRRARDARARRHGGIDGSPASCFVWNRNSERVELPGYHRIVLEEGQSIISISCGGAGYGSPMERDPAQVVKDAREAWITRNRAGDVYGVVVTADGELDDASA